MLDANGRLHDPLGRFARTGRLRVDVSESHRIETARSGRRSDAAFHPPTPVAIRRARKDAVTGSVVEVRDVYAKEPSERSWREKQLISWQSPRKIAEQRALTGDTLMPRPEAIRREASLARMSGHRMPRTEMRRTFTGKPVIRRGTAPEVERSDGFLATGRRFRSRGY